jgi:hypothetical protein
MRLSGQDPKRFGRNKDVDIEALADVDFPVHVRLDIAPVADVKLQAGAQHASQGGGQPRRGWLGFFARVWGGREEYMRAYPIVHAARFRRRSDLFDI